MSLSSLTAALFAVLALAFPLTANAVTLNIDTVTGQLLGADEVDVGGVLYDVDFVDGACVALFDGCDDPSDFTFTTDVDALAAMNALQSQVFVDTLDGNFGTEPELTNGCEDLSSCSIQTPYALSSAIQAEVALLLNLADGPAFSFTDTFTTLSDTTTAPSIVYAQWGLSETAVVPLPASGWLILSGLAGLFLVKRRRAQIAA